MTWMPEVNLTGVDYIGGDLSATQVIQNLKRFAEDSRFAQKFAVFDITCMIPPPVDMIHARDVLMHMDSASSLTVVVPVLFLGRVTLPTCRRQTPNVATCGMYFMCISHSARTCLCELWRTSREVAPDIWWLHIGLLQMPHRTSTTQAILRRVTRWGGPIFRMQL